MMTLLNLPFRSYALLHDCYICNGTALSARPRASAGLLTSIVPSEAMLLLITLAMLLGFIASRMLVQHFVRVPIGQRARGRRANVPPKSNG